MLFALTSWKDEALCIEKIRRGFRLPRNDQADALSSLCDLCTCTWLYMYADSIERDRCEDMYRMRRTRARPRDTQIANKDFFRSSPHRVGVTVIHTT